MDKRQYINMYKVFVNFLGFILLMKLAKKLNKINYFQKCYVRILLCIEIMAQ